MPFVEAKQVSAAHVGTLNPLVTKPCGKDQTAGMAVAITAMNAAVFILSIWTVLGKWM